MSNELNSYYVESNRNLWQHWTNLHIESDIYDVDSFKAGKDNLKKIEVNEVGDVNGKRMLHLQCHLGIDSLCWARRGANVTGVDFCSKSIEEAEKLNEELGLNASFVCSDIYSLKETLKEEKEQFDIVFTSYGIIDWLPDLNEWASVIAAFLKPGGFFYIVDYHRLMKLFNRNYRMKTNYSKSELLAKEIEGSYAVQEPGVAKKKYNWNHSSSEIINSLVKSGLRIDFFNEHMDSPFDCFRKDCVLDDNGSYSIPALKNKVPLLFSLKASKQ